MRYPSPLLQLIALLKKLPGVGSKTAERYAFQLLEWPDHLLADLGEAVATSKRRIKHCAECRCLMEEEVCPFCTAERQKASVLCVIASAKDAYAIEETRSYFGLYHVLGALLSPLDGRHPHDLDLRGLKKRIALHQIKEIIIALDSTLEGDATALYLKEELQAQDVQVSRLAFGLPMGSSLDFVDGGTLSKALTGRQTFI